MKYIAMPIEVEAFEIVRAELVPYADPPLGRYVATNDGKSRWADEKMCARYSPTVGDYWVVQSDGYEYLNPKEVFERKYQVKKEK